MSLPTRYASLGRDIVEPREWPFDEGERREPVIDPNWNGRVVRRVGWRTCVCCGKWFFSPDVARVQMRPYCRYDRTDD